MLGVLVCAYVAVRFSQAVIGPVIPLVSETFAVSSGFLGAALTGMWVAYALVQLPSGVVADRFGERRVILGSLLLTTVATLGLILAPTGVVFAGAVVLLGVAAGAYYNPATTLLARTFSAVGGALGTHRIGAQVAGVLAPLVAAAVGVRFGWRAVFLPGVVLTLVVAAFVGRQQASEPNNPEASLRELLDRTLLWQLLRQRHTRNTTVMMTAVEFTGLAAMAFLPALLVAHHGFSLGRANLLFALFFGISAIAQPVGGVLSDRVGRDLTSSALTAGGAVGYLVLAVGDSSIAVLGVVLVGIAMGVTPVLQSRMLDGLTAETRGTGFGLFRTLYMLGGATGTVVVGTTAETAGWAVAVGLLAGVLALVPTILLASLINGRMD